jgi:hypothetical protein
LRGWPTLWIVVAKGGSLFAFPMAKKLKRCYGQLAIRQASKLNRADRAMGYRIGKHSGFSISSSGKDISLLLYLRTASRQTDGIISQRA